MLIRINLLHPEMAIDPNNMSPSRCIHYLMILSQKLLHLGNHIGVLIPIRMTIISPPLSLMDYLTRKER